MDSKLRVIFDTPVTGVDVGKPPSMTAVGDSSKVHSRCVLSEESTYL